MAKCGRKSESSILSKMILENELNVDCNQQFDFVRVMGQLSSMGVNDTDIGLVLGVALQGEPIDRSKISFFKAKYPQLKKYKADARNKVKQYAIAKLIRLACGYDYQEKQLKYKVLIKEDGTQEMHGVAEVTENIKHRPPDRGALIFLICNLDSTWKSVTKASEVDARSITFQLDGRANSREIAKLAGKLAGKLTSGKGSNIKEIESEVESE